MSRFKRAMCTFLTCAILASGTATTVPAYAEIKEDSGSSECEEYSREELLETINAFLENNADAYAHSEWFVNSDEWTAFRDAYNHLYIVKSFPDKFSDSEIVDACVAANEAFDKLEIDLEARYTFDELLDKLIYQIAYAAGIFFCEEKFSDNENWNNLYACNEECIAMFEKIEVGEIVTKTRVCELLVEYKELVTAMDFDPETDITKKDIFSGITVFVLSIFNEYHSQNYFSAESYSKFALAYETAKNILNNPDDYTISDMYAAGTSLSYHYMNLEYDVEAMFTREELKGMIDNMLPELLDICTNQNWFVNEGEFKALCDAVNEMKMISENMNDYSNSEILNSFAELLELYSEVEIDVEYYYSKNEIKEEIEFYLEMYRDAVEEKGKYIEDDNYKAFIKIYNDVKIAYENIDKYTNQKLLYMIEELRECCDALLPNYENEDKKTILEYVKFSMEDYRGDYERASDHAEDVWKAFSKAFDTLITMLDSSDKYTNTEFINALDGLQKAYYNLITDADAYWSFDELVKEMTEMLDEMKIAYNSPEIYTEDSFAYFKEVYETAEKMIGHTESYNKNAFESVCSFLIGASMLLDELISDNMLRMYANMVQDSLKDVEAIDTVDGYEELVTAVNAALELVETGKSTQKERDAAYKALMEANSKFDKNYCDIIFNENNVTGDADSDKKVSMTDIVLMQRYIAGLEKFDLRQIFVSDVDEEYDKVNMADVVCVQKKIAGLIEIFPAENITVDTDTK